MNNQVHRALYRKEGEGKERERKKVTQPQRLRKIESVQPLWLKKIESAQPLWFRKIEPVQPPRLKKIESVQPPHVRGYAWYVLTRTLSPIPNSQVWACGPSAFHSEFILICVGLLLCF